MRLIRMTVVGEYGCHYDFDNINVVLGANNTGKSTFLKLILYALGTPIKTFIEEIDQQKLCDSISLDVEFKSKKRVRILRKLPASDAIIVTPIKDIDELLTDEVSALSASEFSDYLLEQEGYSVDRITYGVDKHATFRFYFLLRALYVDQITAAHSILSDLDADPGYFSSQPLIKKAIIEKLLGKDNSELQRIRMEIQALSKSQAELTNRIAFLSKQSNELELINDINTRKIEAELIQIKGEREALTDKQFEKVASIQAVNDFQYSEEQIQKRLYLKKLLSEQQVKSLELSDIENVIKSLTQDLSLLKYKIAAKDILEDLPILFCPNCLSPLDEKQQKDGLCVHCHEKTDEDKIINSATLKKTILDSISEANELKQLKENELLEIQKKISDIQMQLADENKKAMVNSKEVNNLIYQAISEIKKRLEYLLKREAVLQNYKDITAEEKHLKEKRKENNLTLTNLKTELLQADSKATLSAHHTASFKRNFEKYLNKMFSEIDTCELDENYMPIIDSIKLNAVSSASLKVAVRLSYVLALLNVAQESEKYNSHVGFILLDSPKDKDLDNDRFSKYLQLLNTESDGQVFVTGSILDEAIYKDNLTNATFFAPLQTSDKLLKPTKQISKDTKEE